jgi:protein TonB
VAVAALLCATASTAAGQEAGGALPKPGIMDIEKIRKQMSGAPADSAAAHAQPAIRLVPMRPVRVPGAPFALGDTLEHVVQRLGLTPDESGSPQPGERVFTGEIRYYGQDAHARVIFADRWLSHAEIETGPLTETVRRYIVDEFLRQGYRRACRSFDEKLVDCTWTGRTIMQMKMDSTAHVKVSLPVEPAPMTAALVAAAPAAVAMTRPVAIPGETLSVVDPPPSGRRRAVPVSTTDPRYPDMARQAHVEGTVNVLAFVDSTGKVLRAEVGHSDNRVFDSAALEAVRQWRFEPHFDGDRPVQFWIEIPIRFRLPRP